MNTIFAAITRWFGRDDEAVERVEPTPLEWKPTVQPEGHLADSADIGQLEKRMRELDPITLCDLPL